MGMKPLSACAAGFWLFAETIIVLSLLWLDARIRRGPWRKGWILYAGLFLGGVILILAGPGLLAPFGPAPFGPRFSWDLLCTIWLVLEWAMLVHITGVTRAAGRRFLDEDGFAIGAGTHAVITVLIIAVALHYHLVIMRREPTAESVMADSYLFVRAAGFGYILLETAIAAALARAFVMLKRLEKLT